MASHPFLRQDASSGTALCSFHSHHHLLFWRPNRSTTPCRGANPLPACIPRRPPARRTLVYARITSERERAPAHSIDTKPLYFRHNEAPSIHPSIHPRAGDSCLVAYFYRGVYGRHDGGRRTVITAASASTNCRQPGISLLISPILHMATCPSATLPRSQLFVPPPLLARPRPSSFNKTCSRSAARRAAC